MELVKSFYNEKDKNTKISYLFDIYNNDNLADLIYYIYKKQSNTNYNNNNFIITNLYQYLSDTDILNRLFDDIKKYRDFYITHTFIEDLLKISIANDDYNTYIFLIDYSMTNKILNKHLLLEISINSDNSEIFYYIINKYININKVVKTNDYDVLFSSIKIIEMMIPMLNDTNKELYIERCYKMSFSNNDVELFNYLYANYVINDINKLLIYIYNIDILKLVLQLYSDTIDPIVLFERIYTKNDIEMINLILTYYPNMISYDMFEESFYYYVCKLDVTSIFLLKNNIFPLDVNIIFKTALSNDNIELLGYLLNNYTINVNIVDDEIIKVNGKTIIYLLENKYITNEVDKLFSIYFNEKKYDNYLLEYLINNYHINLDNINITNLYKNNVNTVAVIKYILENYNGDIDIDEIVKDSLRINNYKLLEYLISAYPTNVDNIFIENCQQNNIMIAKILCKYNKNYYIDILDDTIIQEYRIN